MDPATVLGTVANALVQGVLLGGLYALTACGLSLVFGVMRVVNLAHGDFSVLAAFAAVLLVQLLDVHPLVTLLAVVPLLAGVGYLVQRLLLQRSLVVGGLAPLVVTFGLSLVIQNLLLEAFGADNRRLATGALGTATIRVTDQVSIGVLPLLGLGTAVAALGGLHLVLTRTRTGRAMRATADDPATARLMGIDDRHVHGVAVALAFATVALAGVFTASSSTVTPSSGPPQLVVAFEAVVIGGLGSLRGTLLGAMVLGIVQTLAATASPSFFALAGHLVFLLVLAVRQQGLLGRPVPA